MRPGTDGVELHPLVAAAGGEPVLEKAAPNGFVGTALEDEVRSRGIDELVVAGMMSSMCVDATVRAAVDLGFSVTVVHDGCAAPDLRFGEHRRSPGAMVHAAFMAALADGYADGGRLATSCSPTELPAARRSPRERLGVRGLAVVSDLHKSLPVAVFDSGVGGLTVLHECLVSLPHEDFVYLGDTARFPYGDRTPEQLLAFARELSADPARARARSCSSWPATPPPRRRCRRCARSSRAACRWSASSPRSRGSPRPPRATGGSGCSPRPRPSAAAPTRGRSPRPRPRRSCTRSPRAELAPLIQEGGEVDARVVACVDGLCRPLRAPASTR